MTYSGPALFSVLEDALALSETVNEEWPLLQGNDGIGQPSTPVVPAPPPPQASFETKATSSKRAMDDADTSEEDLAPATKSSRPADSDSAPADSVSMVVGDCPLQEPRVMPPTARPSQAHTQATFSLPAFAPRTDYLKLRFLDNPGVDVKLRWLTEVNRHFSLDRDLAEIKMSAVTSRFVYVSRRRQDIVQSVVSGNFLALKMHVIDSPERPRKLPSYLITRYPAGIDPTLSKELPGVYSARRFRQNGQALNRIVITWSEEEPPPSSVAFTFLPCLPPCEIRPMASDRPTCFRCWEVGHISRYCSATEKCGWCSASHDSRSCPHRGPPPPPTEAHATTPTPPLQADTSNWQCPRCHEKGVSVWHGCPRRRPAPPRQSAPPPPPPSSSPVSHHPPMGSSSPSQPPRVLALQCAVKKLQEHAASLNTRLDTLETTINNLVASQASLEASMATLTEAQHTVVEQLTTLTQRFETWATRLTPTSSAHSLPAASPATPASTVGVSARPGSRPHNPRGSRPHNRHSVR